MFKLILGIFAIAYGVYTLIQRKRKPESFKKLEPMKEAYGKKLGYAIHVIGYSAVPIILGILLVLPYLLQA